MNLTEAERLLGASADYRVLRRVPAASKWAMSAHHGETRRAVLVDTEITGLDPDADEVIELALLPFEYERNTGRIVSVDERVALNAFREPSFAIPPETAKLHGITDAIVKGHAIDAEQVQSIIEPAQLIIAHNAGFDRPMVEKHRPIFEEKHWVCSFVEHRLEGRRHRLRQARLPSLRPRLVS